MYYRNPIVRRSLEYQVAHAEVVITNSIELAAFLQQFNDNISVLPSFFDFSLIPDLGEAYERNYEEVRIGFAGSPSRASDLDIVAPLDFQDPKPYRTSCLSS